MKARVSLIVLAEAVPSFLDAVSSDAHEADFLTSFRSLLNDSLDNKGRCVPRLPPLSQRP